MKNIGIFSPSPIPTDELTDLAISLGGSHLSADEIVFGEPPYRAYLAVDTDLSQGCFDEMEFETLQVQLGFIPQSYVTIHLQYGVPARETTLRVLAAIQAKWGGVLDFSGAGGALGSEAPGNSI